jgi:hypothetical protein
MTVAEQQDLSSLIHALGLKVVKDNWAVGEIDAVSIALNVVATSEAVGLLFHVRYPERTFPSENPPIPENTSLGDLVRAKEAEVSLDSKTGWLNLFSTSEGFSAEKVRGLVLEFFEVLRAQGVDVRQRICLKCSARRVEEPGLADDRLELLCDACKAEAEDAFRRETQLNVGNIPLLIVPGVIAAVIGAVLWAGIWYSYPIVLEKFTRIPIVLLALIYCGAGLAVGKVVSFFITRVRNRGVHFGAAMAVIFCGAAVVLGEGLFVVALCLKYLGLIPQPAAIANLWVSITREFSGLYALGKVISVGTALYIAFSDSRPKRKHV